jgi:uncharacterized SAM-binding protein YcdF (DUF218 family)
VAVAVVALIVGAVALWHVLEVALTNVRDDLRATSCVIVLGAAVWDDKPSPVYEARLRYAVERVGAGRLFLTGGIGADDVRSEAAVGRDYAIARGVAAERVVLEERSRTTAENIANVKPLVGDDTCALVSDPLHLPRALVLADDAGVRAFPAATPYTRYVSLSPRARMLLSEAWYLFRHRVSCTRARAGPRLNASDHGDPQPRISMGAPSVTNNTQPSRDDGRCALFGACCTYEPARHVWPPSSSEPSST